MPLGSAAPSAQATGTSVRVQVKRTAASTAKKRNSSVRKEQNKNASRVYRERRRQRLALLDQLLEKENAQKATQDGSETDPIAGSESLHMPEMSDLSSAAEPSAETVSQPVTSDCLVPNATGDSTSMMGEDLSFDSPWPIVHDNSFFDVDFPELDNGSHKGAETQSILPGRASNSETAITPASITRPDFISRLQMTFGANLGAYHSPVSLTQTPRSQASEQEQDKPDESLQALLVKLMSINTQSVKQVIYVQQNSLFAAIVDNTLALGLLQGAEQIFSEDGNSPFHQQWVASKGGMQLADIKARFAATVPKDLQPLDIQITFEHHVYLDVMPFPIFRENALKALTCDPPLFDEDEMCEDLTVNGGVVCWGSQGNDQGMDACRPWDMRCWEPKPWFLRKYWFLCGAWDDEMWKATRWWHAMRNERIAIGPPDLSKLV